MKYAVIENGAVVNIAEAEADFAATQSAWVPAGNANIGDLWDGQTFTAPVVPVRVPPSVTRRQALRALFLSKDGAGASLLGKVQPAIDAIADAEQRGLMQIEWDESQDFERSRPSLLMLAAALGLTSEQIDALFLLASAQ